MAYTTNNKKPSLTCIKAAFAEEEFFRSQPCTRLTETTHYVFTTVGNRFSR